MRLGAVAITYTWASGVVGNRWLVVVVEMVAMPSGMPGYAGGRRWSAVGAVRRGAAAHTRTYMQDHHPPSIPSIHHPPSINDYFAHVMATACGYERWGGCVRK